MSKPFDCIYVDKARKEYQDNWPAECWPDTLFNYDKNYPCKSCPVKQERYTAYLKDSIKRAEKNPKSNIHFIRKDIKRDGGKYIRYGINDVGLLVAASSTLEDYYWCILDKDRKLRYDTCVDRYEVLDYVPADCSVLEWIRTHNPKELIKIVNNEIANSKTDILITAIKL